MILTYSYVKKTFDTAYGLGYLKMLLADVWAFNKISAAIPQSKKSEHLTDFKS